MTPRERSQWAYDPCRFRESGHAEVAEEAVHRAEEIDQNWIGEQWGCSLPTNWSRRIGQALCLKKHDLGNHRAEHMYLDSAEELQGWLLPKGSMGLVEWVCSREFHSFRQARLAAGAVYEMADGLHNWIVD